MTVSLERFQSITKGTSSIDDSLTPRMPTWRHVIRAKGGFWYGESEYAGNAWEMQNFFDTALFNRIVESSGGVVTWEGFVGEMTMTYSNGDKIVKGTMPWSNRIRVIYSKIFPNLLTNGSAESGAWTPVSTPPTHAVDTSWRANGTQSMHVVTDAADEGTEVQSNVAITASVAYDVRFDVKIDSGTWTLFIYDTGTSDVVASRAALNDGEQELKLQIPESNTATGVDVQILDSSGAGEIWIDAGVFQKTPVRATTSWYEDISSMSELGTKELIISKAGMADVAARSEAQIELAKRTWPRTRGSDDPVIATDDEMDHVPNEIVPVSLIVSVYGYVKTLGWKYVVSVSGVDDTSVHIIALIAESEFITAGSIQENTSEQKVEVVDIPSTIWDAMVDLIESGEDGDTTSWMGGVYAGRKFRYEKRPTAISMYRKGAGVESITGEIIPPWAIRPGLIQYPNLSGQGGATALDQDRPGVEFIREVEYNMADNSAQLIKEKDE